MARLTPEQMALVQRESANVEQQFKLLQQSYGADQLDLVLARSYVARAMSNPRVALFLEQHYAELYMAFIRLTDDRAAA